MSAHPVIECDQVVKVYRSGLLCRRTVRALDGVSLKVRPGEVFGLIGPNRAGKTTLIKILLSVCQPTSGVVRRFGQSVTNRRTLARIGYMHERQVFPTHLSAVGLLEFCGALTLLDRKWLKRRIPQLLDEVGLTDRAREPISHFSKGMVQRLALAQSLINDPDLLVLDEPSEGLDLVARRSIEENVERLRRRGGSVILATHLLSDVERFCDRVAVLRQGRLAFSGPLAELLAHRSGAEPLAIESAVEPLYQGA